MDTSAQRHGITGAGGFIGLTIVRRLRAAGHDVRGLDLDRRAEPELQAVDAELHTGDICDPEAMVEFCAGLDTVWHTAAIVEESGDLDRFRRVNVEGARTVARAARDAGVRRLVHFSSVMVYGFDFPDGVTEDGPFDGADNPYCITKHESEAAVLESHEPGVFDVFVIRPGDVYGPGCVPWIIRPFEAMQAGLWATIETSPPALLNHVYVDNLLDGIDVVLDAGRSGEPFVITDGRRTTTVEFFGHLLGMLGITDVPSIDPDVAVELGLDREAVRHLQRSGQYSIDKVRALGYEPTVDLDEGMARTEEWLRASGRLTTSPD
ncbi:MAG: NAD-dependent epimerase/dehydratase family protein [Acidimicrobiia bacterium]|nr:NAD-dependent epimerase/dehydratase family protein [Acidimicrobiia bacterium]